MKVLHILDTLQRGGVAMLMLDVCRNAAANNLELTLVATGGGDLEEDFRVSGIEFIRLRRRYPFDPLVVAKLREIIRQRNIQVVHAHQAVEALHAYFATRGTNVKRALSFHGCVFDARNKLALKFLIPRMNTNIAVSRAYLSRLKTEEGFNTSKNFRVVYNGVDMTRLPTTSRHRLRAELKLREDDMLLGMVGNFYPGVRKDQLTICRALPQTFAHTPNAHFVFVGGRSSIAPELQDDCVSYCRAQVIDGRVHFLGQRADVPDVLSALDIFVLSSTEDTFGIAVVEAMAMGLPVIVSDIPPLIEVTGNGEYALSFRAQDAEDLAQKLLSLINNPAARAQLGAKARAWASQQFGIDAYIARLIILYNEMIRAT